MYALRLEAGQRCDPAIPVDVNRGVIGLGFCCTAIRDRYLAIGCFPAIIDRLFYPISPHTLSKLLGIRMGGTQVPKRIRVVCHLPYIPFIGRFFFFMVTQSGRYERKVFDYDCVGRACQ